MANCIAFLIATIPFLFYLNELFPNAAIWESSFFVYQSRYYENINVFTWVLLGKLIPLLLFLIWFFTCKHWWYMVIMVPIALYTFQLLSIVVEDSDMIDYKDIYVLIPITGIILMLNYIIRNKLFDIINGVDLSELTTLSKTHKRTWWNKLR